MLQNNTRHFTRRRHENTGPEIIRKKKGPLHKHCHKEKLKRNDHGTIANKNSPSNLLRQKKSQTKWAEKIPEIQLLVRNGDREGADQEFSCAIDPTNSPDDEIE